MGLRDKFGPQKRLEINKINDNGILLKFFFSSIIIYIMYNWSGHFPRTFL